MSPHSYTRLLHANQEDHHRKRTYAEEYETFDKWYGWNGGLRETIKMVRGFLMAR